jgi:DNA-binding response OmpR family regulator
MRVLAFEDHYDIEALLTAGGVNMEGITIEQRWNSSNALEWIQDFAPDVLLLDHYMPPLSGFQVLEALLNSEVKRPSTVIAMSSATDKNRAMVARGADLGVVKFDLAELEIWPQPHSA